MPVDSTHWTIRSLAAESRLTRNAIVRIHAFGLQAYRIHSFTYALVST